MNTDTKQVAIGDMILYGYAYKTGGEMKLRLFIMTAVSGVLSVLLLACPVPENEFVRNPVEKVQLLKNQQDLDPGEQFAIQEGASVVLGAKLLPQGVSGGIHWQSSRQGIVEMSALTGPNITITGTHGGKTIITVMARNIYSEVYAEAECIVTVIPNSFFKWSYRTDGWIDLPALNNAIVGKISEMLIRAGETDILPDDARGGMVLEGAGARLIIGSVMVTPTTTPFAGDPVYDQNGALDFLDGPSRDYLLWNKRVRISVDYETLSDPGSDDFFRIQVNNNTGGTENASAISNWLVTKLQPDSPRSGTLTGIFNSRHSILVKDTDITALPDKTQLETVLANSFVCLYLSGGKMIIRGIRIESAD